MTEKIGMVTGSLNRLKTWVNKRIRISDHNTFVGEDAGKVTTGDYNNFIGYHAGYLNTSGAANNFMGNSAGYSNTTGNYNSAVGSDAGFSNSAGHQNVFIGFKAGYYETGNNKLFIDDAQRSDEADGRIKALVYGVFAATTAAQRLSINARLLVREVTTYTDDAAAGTGGLVAGEMYKHADGSLHIKL